MNLKSLSDMFYNLKKDEDVIKVKTLAKELTSKTLKRKLSIEEDIIVSSIIEKYFMLLNNQKQDFNKEIFTLDSLIEMPEIRQIFIRALAESKKVLNSADEQTLNILNSY